MSAAFEVLVIAAVFLAALLTLALAGVIGALVARRVAAGEGGGDGRRWVGIAAASGVAGGQVAAFVAFVGSAAVGWSLEGFVLPPVCWMVAAASGAAMTLATRSSGDLPRPG